MPLLPLPAVRVGPEGANDLLALLVDVDEAVVDGGAPAEPHAGVLLQVVGLLQVLQGRPVLVSLQVLQGEVAPRPWQAVAVREKTGWAVQGLGEQVRVCTFGCWTKCWVYGKHGYISTCLGGYTAQALFLCAFGYGLVEGSTGP